MNEALDVNVSNDHHDLLVVKEEWKGKRSSKENDRYGGRKIECLAVEVLEQAAHGGLCAVCGEDRYMFKELRYRPDRNSSTW